MKLEYYLYIFLYCVVIFQLMSKIAIESYENQGDYESPWYHIFTSAALISVFVGANSLMYLATKVEEQNNVEKEVKSKL